MNYIYDSDVHNMKSAEQVVPLLLSILKINSVLDVGCGLGSWLSVFNKNGVVDIFGVDGNDIKLAQLKISKKDFKSVDFNKENLNLDRSFDLVLCLEVAEHIESKKSSSLVQALVNHGKTVMFSAALPFQEGQNHINEMPLNYWVGLFAKYGYKPYDILRPIFWENEFIHWWYRQNMILFSKDKSLDALFSRYSDFGASTIVHPKLLRDRTILKNSLEKRLYAMEEHKRSFKFYLKQIYLKILKTYSLWKSE